MGVTRAIYPGSFDPLTLGHIDIIHRACHLFDSLIVAVAHNEAKRPLFSADERISMIEEALQDTPNILVKKLDGLLVDFARGGGCICRHPRSSGRFRFRV